MVIFKAFLQILNKNKGILFIYSLILVIFSVFSLQSNETTTTFESTKPDIYIINHDLDASGAPSTLSQSLTDYLAKHSNIVELDASEQSSGEEQLRAHEALDDAIFYRQVNFALEIPKDFEANFLTGTNPAISFKSAGDYNASLAEMNLERYLELANSYLLAGYDAPALARKVETTLEAATPVSLLSHLDTGALARASYYYNFLNYPLLVGCIFMICLVFLSFRDQGIARRLAISAVPQTKINRILLGANLLFAFALWLVYVALSFIIVGGQMLSGQGMMLILSSLVFTICVVSLAFLFANLIKNRNALNGIVNVVGLGSSFVCGVFVPMEWLPDSVRVVAHVLPSYWYVEANNQIAALEDFSWASLAGIFGCFLAIIAFSIGFIILTNLISARKKT